MANLKEIQINVCTIFWSLWDHNWDSGCILGRCLCCWLSDCGLRGSHLSLCSYDAFFWLFEYRITPFRCLHYSLKYIFPWTLQNNFSLIIYILPQMLVPLRGPCLNNCVRAKTKLVDVIMRFQNTMFSHR